MSIAMINKKINQKKTITIWRLYTRAMREMFWIVAVFSISMFLLMNYVQIRDYGWTDWPVFEILIESSRFFLFLGLFVYLGCMPFTLKGIICLKRQERVLGLNFNQEMKNTNITKFNHQDNNWFITITLARIIVYHRNYIASIGKIEGSSASRMLWETSVVGIDNIEVSVRGDEVCLNDLKQWWQT